jgi:hypothetical protein
MVTKLDKTLKRELSIKGRAYILTLDDAGLKLTLKGHRKGQELLWDAFVTGEAALATALNASLAQANDAPKLPTVRKAKAKQRRSKRS